jgi:hypothetical protein
MASTNPHRLPPAAPATGGGRRTLLAKWHPAVIAYREELRRAVLAIEERRQRRMRMA